MIFPEFENPKCETGVGKCCANEEEGKRDIVF